MTWWYPPTYYNHFVEHPVLWSDEKRRWEERKLAHECFHVWQTQKRVEQSKKLKSQAEYRDMIANWNPWGKPGNGAPNNDIRIRNLEVDELYPVAKNSPRNSFTLPRTTGSQSKTKYYSPGMSNPVSGGSGAPIISETGKLLVPLREDPNITFSDSTRSFVEKDLRYRKTPSEKTAYRQELDKIVEEKKRLKFNEKFGISPNRNLNSLDPFSDSWGRPGPGGAPWRDPKNVGQNFMKSMGWTSKDTLKSINNDINFNQSQTLPKNYPRCRQQQTGQVSCCEKCSCECVKKIERTILKSPSNAKENDEPVQRSPKKTPHYALPQQCNREKLEPLQQVSQQSSKAAKQLSTKKPSKTNLISGGVELVPLLAKRRDERPISLSTTDITKYKINKSSRQDGDPEYLSDLERQILQRNHLRQLSKEREVESCRQHFANFDRFWGRPGCGAPQQIKHKMNLENLLYNAPMFEIYQQEY